VTGCRTLLNKCCATSLAHDFACALAADPLCIAGNEPAFMIEPSPRDFHLLHPKLLWPLMVALLVINWCSGFVGNRYANQVSDVAMMMFWRMLLL